MPRNRAPSAHLGAITPVVVLAAAVGVSVSCPVTRDPASATYGPVTGVMSEHADPGQLAVPASSILDY
jgi:hypothetical protein